MMLFKGFRIRRHLCDHCLTEPSVVLIVNTTGRYNARRYYCQTHEYKGVYWAGVIGKSAKLYHDTGAIRHVI